MLNSQTLDIVIGLAVVFLTVSLVCSSINELISGILSLRASTLRDALDSLLGSDLAQKVIDHPVVPAAQSGSDKRPSYIEPTLFATALIDTVTKGVPAPVPPPGQSAQMAHVTDAVAGSAPSPVVAGNATLQNSLSAFLRTASGDYTAFHDQVSSWFDAYMDRIGGDYKRRAHIFTAIIALLVVAILNVNTLTVYRKLSADPAFVQAVSSSASIASAEKLYTQVGQQSGGLGGQLDTVNAVIGAIPIPIGWHKTDVDGWQKVLETFFGLLITAIAASLGAPFWFDVLGKLANLRSTGSKPNGSASSS